MTFPLDITTQLLLDGTWTDISGDVLQRDDMEITRGRSDEASQGDPSSCKLTLKNPTGNYSPRNPTGAYYGLLGRNTPLRVLTTPGSQETYLALPGDTSAYVSTPDTATLDITGDIDVRVELTPTTWQTFAQLCLVEKWESDSDERSWSFYVDDGSTLGSSSGALGFAWTTAGTSATVLSGVSTVAVPAASGRLAVRVTLDVNDGAGGRDLKFYTAPSLAGSWTQLGSTVHVAATTSIYSGTADLHIGGHVLDGLTASHTHIQGRVHGVEVYDGIGGTLRASPDFTDLPTVVPTFVDAQGLTWTIEGTALVVDPNARFHGELSSLPQRWDTSGNDVYTPVVAAGVMRRLSQGAAPLKSVLYRALTTDSTVVGYWPCEDGEGATELAAGTPGVNPMSLSGPDGAAPLASSSFSEFKASLPIPTTSGLAWASQIPPYTSTNVAQVRFLMAVPSDGVALTPTMCLFTVGSTEWTLRINAAGSMELRGANFGTTFELLDGGYGSFNINGKLLRVSIELTRNSSTAIDWQVVTLEPDATAVLSTSGTFTFASAHGFDGVVSNVTMNPYSQASVDDGVALGHISVHNTITPILDLADDLNAYRGETAVARITRLCSLEGVAVQIIGEADGAATVGAQLPKTLLELLREAAAADMGILYEPRGFLGLAYRTRRSLYSQDPGIELDYSSAAFSDVQPDEDDQGTRNDVTVRRVDGGAGRATLTTGPLSVNAPPAGVGRYDEEITVNLAHDADLRDQASWRVHLGTVDEARFPKLGINLARSPFTGDPVATAAAQALDVGDKITVTNLPAWVTPDDSPQLAQGFTETLTRFGWVIDLNCSPASPWDVAVYGESTDAGEARYSSTGTVLNEDLTTTETGVDVAAPGALWTAVDQPFDIWVGGERMTVTAVSGSSSPQTFTVTRSVNGVVKTHTTGAAVRLFKPAIYAL